MFFITHTEISEGSAVIIGIEGPLNSESSPDFDDYTSKLIDNNIIHILMDMDKLSFISSEGIGAVLLMYKIIHEKNGLIVFYNLNYETASLFKLLGFDKIFTMAEDRADALQILDRYMELHPASHDREMVIQETDGQDQTPAISEEISDFIEEDNGFDHIIDASPVETDFVPEEKVTPFVIECLKCKSLIRVKERGDQMCPYCDTEFTVTGENKAEFILPDNVK